MRRSVALLGGSWRNQGHGFGLGGLVIGTQLDRHQRLAAQPRLRAFGDGAAAALCRATCALVRRHTDASLRPTSPLPLVMSAAVEPGPVVCVSTVPASYVMHMKLPCLWWRSARRRVALMIIATGPRTFGRTRSFTLTRVHVVGQSRVPAPSIGEASDNISQRGAHPYRFAPDRSFCTRACLVDLRGVRWYHICRVRTV